ncbi:unnamed protein product [Calypogeia fissa]
MCRLEVRSTASKGAPSVMQGTRETFDLDQSSSMSALSDEEHALPGPTNQCSSENMSIITTKTQVLDLDRPSQHAIYERLENPRFKIAVLTVPAALWFVHRFRPPRAHLWYEDPITCDMMCDPVKCNDGRTYDRWTVIDNGLTKSPFTRRGFCILVDDVDVRSWLFSTSPEQEAQFLSKRVSYRAKALQYLRNHPLEVKVAVQMLKNVRQWAPEDKECQSALNIILSSISCESGQLNGILPHGSDSEVYVFNQVPATMEGSQNNPNAIRRRRLSQERNSEPRVLSERSQTYVIPVISHDDLIRERYGDGRFKAVFYFVFFMGVCFILFESQRASQSPS